MKAFLIFVILYTIVPSGFCWRFFHNGRLRDGNFGVPNVEANNFTRWFTQNLDHFDVTNQDTWQQRYQVNDEFFDKSKRDVAFLHISGEAKADELWMTNGKWIKEAKKHKAILFQLEHRFYGQSHPTKDLSVDNLKYLTTDHALADLAVFIAAMKDECKLSPTVKWIVFGGSYAGSLAAWSRLKYPHLIHGAVSSSAPLKAVVDFEETFQVVADDLRDISKNCLAAVQKGTAQIDALLEQKSGQNTLTELFQLCDPLSESVDNENDISNLYSSLAENIDVVAQYNKNNPLAPGAQPSEITLDLVCNIMTNSSLGDEVNRLAKINDVLLKIFKDSCLDFKYDKMIEAMRNTSLNGPQSNTRLWTFQTCNEFGFFATSNKKPQIFGNKFPTKFFIQWCMDIYGPKFNETYLNSAVNRFNTLYGALNIKVDNVVFVHGSVDPWHKLGITKTIHQGAPAIFIKGAAHCADTFPQLESDPPQLKAAREEIGKLIQHWLHS